MKAFTGITFPFLSLIGVLGLGFSLTEMTVHAQGTLVMTNTVSPTTTNAAETNAPELTLLTNAMLDATNVGVNNYASTNVIVATNIYSFTNFTMVTNSLPLPYVPPPKPWYKRFWDWLWRW